MRPTRAIIISIISLGLGYSACSVDPCNRHVEDCSIVSPLGAISSILPRRLPIDVDTELTIMPDVAASVGDQVKILQDGNEVVLDKIANNGKIIIPVSKLSGKIRLGSAKLKIGTNPEEEIRFYLSPKFINPMIYTVPGDKPKWVGIGDGQRLIMLSDDTKNTTTPLHFLEFPLNNFITPIETGRYPRQNVQVTNNGQFKFSAHPDGNANPANTVLLRKCQVGAGSCAQEIQTAYTSVTNISVNRAGTLLAVVANQKVDAYSIASSFDTSSPRVSLSGVSNPTLAAAGDLSGDGLSDILIWSDDKFSVFRQMASPGKLVFNIDADLTAQVNQAIGANAPSQVIIYDVDGDGLEDVVFSDNVQISWLVNMGNYNGSKISFVKSLGTPISIAFNSFSIGDLDQDGKADLIFVSMSSKLLGYHLNQATY